MSLKPLTVMTSAVVAGLFACAVAEAALVTYASGLAVGIQDLDVDGVHYDVAFRFGSYDTIFAVETPTFLGNALGANHAADAMLALLNAESPVPRIGDGSENGGLWVVYDDREINHNDPTMYTAKQLAYSTRTAGAWQRFGDFADFKSADETAFNEAFAVFTPRAGVIPEPISSALVALGLVVMGWSRRSQCVRG